MPPLTQEEFNQLFALQKRFSENDTITLEAEPWTRDINALTTQDVFKMDYYRGGIDFKKYVFNKRYRNVVVLVRLCSKNRHTNPDGTIFEGAHLHIYREGYDDKIAISIENLGIEESDLDNKSDALTAFLAYCNIEQPQIQTSLET